MKKVKDEAVDGIVEQVICRLRIYLSGMVDNLGMVIRIPAYILVFLIGVQILSKVFLTAKTLNESSGWWALTYFLVVVAFGCVITWGIYRAIKKETPKARRPVPSGKQQSENIDNALNSANGNTPTPLPNGILEVPVVGVRYAGKSSLIHACGLDTQTTKSLKPGFREVQLIEVPTITSDYEKNKQQLSLFNNAPLSILVASQDLTNYELEAVRYLVGNGSPVLIVLNKADNLTKDAISEISSAIRNKIKTIPGVKGPAIISAAPAPNVRITQDKAGNEEVTKQLIVPDLAQFKDQMSAILKARDVAGFAFHQEYLHED